MLSGVLPRRDDVLLVRRVQQVKWSTFVGKDSRDIIRELEADGWYFIGASGSHHHFKHPTKPGKVTLPHPRKDCIRRH
jgi:predicted RNA binding protein YcfA (HicA-like mRNA interferase family)